MKYLHISLVALIVMIMGLVSCQSPEELMPSISRQGINSITASFPDDDSDENSFSSEIDYANLLFS